MFRIDNATSVATQPAPPAAGTPGYFTDGSPGGGVPATIVPAWWMNQVQEELVNAIVSGGLTPSKTDATQLAQLLTARSAGRLINIQRFTSSGTFTPSAGATKALVRGMGAGSAGAGAASVASTSNVSIGAGGHAGAYGELWIPSGLTSQPVTVGAGGTGVVGGAGGAGGATSFGSLMVCGGGPTSTNIGTTAPPLLVYAATGAPASISGSGNITVRGIGALGGLGVALNGTQSISGQGASTQWGQGGQAASSGGLDAGGYGAGGSGGMAAQGGSAQKGGTGAPGLLIVMEFA